MLEEYSRVTPIDRLVDEHVIYSNDQYVCLMKLFPACGQGTPLPEDHHSRFHLRFYIPRAYLTDAKRKASRTVILTNGLDEYFSFSLYDELGCRLASRGLVAVLLPLPDHLNRHTRMRKQNPTLEQIRQKPSEILMRNPKALYDRYVQFNDELAFLVDHIKQRNCASPEGPCDFFGELFAKDVRVSLLGYSLGAPAMLCAFLERESQLNACFLFNGAINLRDIEPGRMFEKGQWKDFVKRLYEGCREYMEAGNTTDKLFEEVFLGQYIGTTPELLKKHSRRLLFFFGGRDSMISYDSLKRISPDRWGLGMFVLPGINHFIGMDEEWRQWSDLVADLIAAHEQNAARETITKKAVKNLAAGQSDSPAATLLARAHERAVRVRARILGWNPEDLVVEEKEKKRFRAESASKKFEELRIGEMVMATKLGTYLDVERAIRMKEENPDTRVGENLVTLGVVKREYIEELVRIQKR